MSQEIENEGFELNTNTEVEDAEEHIDGLVVEIAKKGGWAPKADWRGKPEDWKNAPEFLERQVTRVPELEGRIRQREKVNEEALRLATQRERELARQEMLQAIETGDKDRALAASQRMVEDPAVEQFKAKNASWLGIDAEATQLATMAAQVVADRRGSSKEQVEYAQQMVERAFPNLFKYSEEIEHDVETPKVQNRAPSVQPATRSTPQTQSAEKGWGNIPRVDREGMKEVLHMLTANYNMSKEAAQVKLAKEYWSN